MKRQLSSHEVCLSTGIDYDTLKYYCRLGLIPDLQRRDSGRFLFRRRDLPRIQTLMFLRSLGCGIEEMRTYLSWCVPGREAANLRLRFLEEETRVLRRQRQDIDRQLELLKIYQNRQRQVIGKTCRDRETQLGYLLPLEYELS